MYIKSTPKVINVNPNTMVNDCTINAVGSALGLSYDLSKKILQMVMGKFNGELIFAKTVGIFHSEYRRRFNVMRVCKALSVREEIRITEEEINSSFFYPAKGYTVDKFAEENPKGVYILLVQAHLLTVIDGILIDNFDSGKLEVEIIYEIDVELARRSVVNLAKTYDMDNEEHFGKHIRELLEEGK